MGLIKCPNCGKFISDEAEKCFHCGKEVSSKLKVGERIVFGQYYINGKALMPLTWKVLAVKDGKALIITEKCIEGKLFNNSQEKVTWENCSLREWLNNEFYSIAFSEEEQEMIVPSDVISEDGAILIPNSVEAFVTRDKVFILSVQEAYNYFDNDESRRAIVTQQAKNNGADYDFIEGNGRWWLRTTFSDIGVAYAVLFLGRIGEFGYPVSDEDGCVRPVVWVKI